MTLRDVGSSGGQAAAFTYDLARSIVWTRQGNPAWSGQERDDDSTPLIRSNDLFFGAASFDPQPDWIDLNKVAIPQADEQQRLLANLIVVMNRDRKPLPRFWYLPRGERAAVVMTGDDHGNNGTTGRFQQYQALSPSGCSVDQWECVRGTSYIYPNTPIAPSQAAAFDAAGFEIGVHVNTGCANWTPSSLQTFYTNDLAAFATAFPALPAPATNRTHCIAWSDYVDAGAGAGAARDSLRHELLLLARHVAAGSPRLLHGIGHADALRGHQRDADRHLSGDDAVDGRVVADVPIHHRQPARQGARARGLLRGGHGEHAHGLAETRRAPTRSSTRR